MNKELIETLERLAKELESKAKTEKDIGYRAGLMESSAIVYTELANQLVKTNN